MDTVTGEQNLQENEANREQDLECQSVLTLKGVGPAVASKLEKLGISTIRDVLFHLPLKYEDRTRVVAIGGLRPGQQAVIEGIIEHAEVRFSGRSRSKRHGGRSLLCYLSDGTGGIVLRFFHFSTSQQANLKKGARLRCFGEVRAGVAKVEMTHPEYRRLQDKESFPVEESLTPVYPKTEGVSQTLMRSLSKQVIDKLVNHSVPEWLPRDCANENEIDLKTALKMIHRPAAGEAMSLIEQGKHPAQQRLIFEELISHQLSMLQLRKRIRKSQATAVKINQVELNNFIAGFGFELTRGQKKAITEIQRDLEKNIPMLRLLQGDVGSGKTAVAACAIFPVVMAGCQVAIMAPTEILADQLHNNFVRWFDNKDCVKLSGKDRGKPREEILRKIKNGTASIVIGTHALFQSDVEFKKLSMIVIDEQHRFGVHQRLALREKGKTGSTTPHQLIMTATPIPRSLAMTAYADLDYSMISELPKDRKPVTTIVVSESRREEVIDRVASACKQGEQAYWVCTLVEESDYLQCEAAEVTHQRLSDELRGLEIGLIHGRMRPEEKESMVTQFRDGKIDLLVATTVIEVGVDVPNASLMIIENAERLGLAQLHQLRGRVGRGGRQSTCVLMYHPPLSARGKERLSILRETSNGFEIAKKDLLMRGPGEVLGTRQAGLVEMRIADVVRDEYLFSDVKRTARLIQERYPENINPLIARWLGSAHQFGSV